VENYLGEEEGEIYIKYLKDNCMIIFNWSNIKQWQQLANIAQFYWKYAPNFFALIVFLA